MFEKILIANRGEIACRIIKTAHRMGVRTVAVFSEADADARHVRLADEAICIGPAAARQSYLVIEKIIAAAKRAGAQAIHPGYGFLSENEAFCCACAEAGLVFIGPPAAAIHAMGSKSEAKKLMQAAGVPLTPGYHGDDQDPERLRREADNIGYPVLIKAAAGGGGKGMRRVERREDFFGELESCQREARAAFGDAHVLIERYVTRPRHVEIQIFGDTQGDYVYLFERDCSVQRRHQKVLEEAPAPGLSEARRAAMGQAAVEAARAVNYVGAGTVEFIVAPDGAFYFMEMNARLQVEHPVTEMITGLDLVEWQLRVADGERLPLSQDQLVAKGHAIEARIYAEDPSKGFLPSTGKLLHLSTPLEGAHVRVDAGVEEGDVISPFYDPMIAKLIVWDETRAKALGRMRAALDDFRVAGLANNIGFLSQLISCRAFAAADLDTGLIERESAALFRAEQGPPDEAFFLAALAQLLGESERATLSPCEKNDGWRINGPLTREIAFRWGETTKVVAVTYLAGGFRLTLGARSVTASGRMTGHGRIAAEFDGHRIEPVAVQAGGALHIFLRGGSWKLEWLNPLDVAVEGGAGHGGLVAPMPGRIIALLAEPEAKVERGAPLLILEAMKMEHKLSAPSAGVVRAYRCAVDDQVSEGAELVDFVAEPA
ncbi:3-methylcrotonyl-CoA carboxylase alpha subunit [Rhodoblastus acidophilus]|uniref:acetyl-CoA carboxylase biotin carboxylase subunit n=1 Tax=Rhodoblastus acidophilus TaxID=1074 RepID=UPI002224D11B|nr:acetyl/propionyl/methylcrotonyl-CoA carboxylase subunit alpha [Rhodoblastus acidophilus]MCW2318744.1 3-methylcrotonyl-CoA carboxylase alpha subunit [Rhodoblastus acidophilus]